MSFAADGAAQIQPMSGHVGMVTHGTDKGLMAEFFVVDEYKPFQSEKEGRAIYEPIHMVRISAPGAKTDIIQRVKMQDDVDGPAHINRFPAQWKAFLAQQEQVPDGTSLEMCKFIPSHRVKMLKAMGVHTAEQYADAPDSILQTMGMGAAAEREKCRTYLANDDEKVRHLSKALSDAAEARDEAKMLKEQMADLNRRMAEMMANRGQIYQSTLEQVAPLPGEVFEEAPGPHETRRGPGRPRKDAA